MRMLTTGAALGLALLPLAALAANPAPIAQAVANTPSADPVVCHYYYHEGAVIHRPVCFTAHEWERQRLLQQRLFREFQQRALLDHM